MHLKYSTKFCLPATDDDYDNINDFKADLETTYQQTITDLLCHSNYLKFYVLSLLLALFIF